MDGFKISQRKILWGMLKKNVWKKQKLESVANAIADISCYHHGPISLQGAMIKMAQNFVGSGNINLLYPAGQYGCVDPETDILIWNNFTKKAKDIVKGDILVGDDGTQRHVIKTVKGIIVRRSGRPITKNCDVCCIRYNDCHRAIQICKCLNTKPNRTNPKRRVNGQRITQMIETQRGITIQNGNP